MLNTVQRLVVLLIAFLMGSEMALANTFKIAFDWGNIPLCDNGNPNTVNNPVFKISDAPKGTASIKFTLVDEDVPQYNHGGGTVAYKNEKSIKSGLFKYQSPCPPNGSHTYTWTAVAYDADGNELGMAKASKEYP